MPNFTNPYNNQNGFMSFDRQSQNPQMSYIQPNMNQQPAFDQSAQNWKPFSPQPKLPPLLGKWVNSFDDIKPMDVPMDGSICFFPQADRSCIYAMVWSNDGTITPYRFLPERNESVSVQQTGTPEINSVISSFENVGNMMVGRFDSLETKLNDIYNQLSNQTKSTKTRNNKDGDQA